MVNANNVTLGNTRRNELDWTVPQKTVSCAKKLHK